MKIAWITDSTSSLSQDFIEKNHIFVVPLNILFDDQSFRENVDITEKEFYEKIRIHKGSLKTSQPAIGEFVELYEKLKEEYDMGIAVHATSKLSGTYQTSKSAAEMVGFKLFAVDSKTGSYPISYMIKKGIELAEAGEDVNRVISQLEEYATLNHLYFVPSNLDQLHKSGRVSGSSALLANLLKIRPMLSLENGGEVLIKEKLRTDKKARAWLLDRVEEALKTHTISTIAILHADDIVAAESLKQAVQERFPGIETVIMMFIPVVGVHAGAGTIGLSWVKEKRPS